MCSNSVDYWKDNNLAVAVADIQSGCKLVAT